MSVLQAFVFRIDLDVSKVHKMYNGIHVLQWPTSVKWISSIPTLGKLSAPYTSTFLCLGKKPGSDIVDVSELLEFSVTLTRVIVTSGLPKEFTHGQGLFWIGKYIVCTQLPCFRAKDVLMETILSQLPSGLGVWFTYLYTRFIGSGEDQSYRRVSMNVRAEVALSKF